MLYHFAFFHRNHIMRPTIICLLCVGMLFLACKKNKVSPLTGYKTNSGELLHYNEAACPEVFCGGMLIHIDDDTSKNAPDHYLYNGTLQNLGISDTTKFPINVTLTWKRDTGLYGSYNFILIAKVKRR
jgi:hypothetical protein